MLTKKDKDKKKTSAKRDIGKSVVIPRGLYEALVKNLAVRVYEAPDQQTQMSLLKLYTELIVAGGPVELPMPPEHPGEEDADAKVPII